MLIKNKKQIYIKFINLIQKKGKKQKYINIISKCFKNLLKTHEVPQFFFEKTVIKAAPYFGIKKHRINKGFTTYSLTNIEKQKISIIWLIKAIKKTKKTNIENFINQEIINFSKNRGCLYNNKIDYYIQITITKSKK